MNLRLFAVLPLAGLLWLGAPRSAHAQRAPVDAIAEADAHFKQGVQLFKQGRYDAALAEFRQAHGLAPDWRVLFNIGRSCDELHDAACALSAFEAYLRDGKDLSDERVADVERAIERLRPSVGSLRVVVGEGAELSLDDASLSAAEAATALRVNVGTHRLVARFGEHIEARHVEVAGGQELTVEFRAPAVPAAPELTPAAEPPRARPPAPAPRQAAPTERGPLWVGWTASGALLAAGAVTGALALSARDDARDTARYGASAGLDAANRRMHRLAAVSDGLIGAALLTAGVTLYFSVREPAPKAKTASKLSLSIAATHVQMGGAF